MMALVGVSLGSYVVEVVILLGSYVVVAGNLLGSYVVVILDSDDPSTCNICSHFNTL